MVNRRRWIMGAAAVGRILGANERIGVGVIGAGGRGRYLIQAFKEDAAADVRAVCDVYQPNLERGVAAAGERAKSYDDHWPTLSRRASASSRPSARHAGSSRWVPSGAVSTCFWKASVSWTPAAWAKSTW